MATTDLKTAFENIDICIMVGAFPRRPGMERKDLLEKNCGIFKEQGRALSDYAKKDVKVLVVGNPANTNCLIALKSAPNLGPQNFSALTRLDHNRAKSLLARRANATVQSVKNVIIWGNHSSTQYPDVSHGTVNGQAITQAVNDQDWLHGEFISTVQQRGAAIINARVPHPLSLLPMPSSITCATGSSALLTTNLFPWP